jgi:hypothetical protein
MKTKHKQTLIATALICALAVASLTLPGLARAQSRFDELANP